MDALQALATRRSTRKYRKEPIGKEQLEAILNAGRLAPCGNNRQAWRFAVIEDGVKRAKIAAGLPHGRFVADAAVCVVVYTSDEAATPVEDASSATACMLVAAHALGLAGCWINGASESNAAVVDAVVCPPAGWTLRTIMAFGVPEAAPGSPAKKSLAEIVVSEGWT